MARIELRALPPEAAVRYLESKGYALSPGFSWKDHWQADHAAAFTVAKAMSADILQDIHSGVVKALKEGRTFRQFRQELEPQLRSKGWWGRKSVVDPQTGEEREAQLGSGRRLRTIFDVNMRMAHAAGAWARIERTKASFPYLRYVAILDDRVRPDHRVWHGTIFPVTHAFWDTHYPPNGWRCRCSVQQLSERDLARRGLSVSPDRKIQTRSWLNDRTGEVQRVPVGIDPGFAYNPGRAAIDRNAARIFGEKSVGWEPRIAAEATAAAARFLDRTRGPEFRDWLEGVAKPGGAKTGGAKTGRVRVVGSLTAPLLDALANRGVDPVSGAITIRDSVVRHMLRDAKKAPVSRSVIRRLPELLASPQAVLRDKRDGDLLYVLSSKDGGPSKVVVQLDFADKGQTDAGRRRFRSAAIRTAGKVDESVLRDPNAYEVISGSL